MRTFAEALAFGCACACSRRGRSFACCCVRVHVRSPVAITWRVCWRLRLRRMRCTYVVYSSLSRLLSVVRETLRRHRWLATSRALRPKSVRSLDSYVDRPTPTRTCKRKQARVRKLASAIRPRAHAPQPHEYARTPASSERRGSQPLGRRDMYAVFECAPIPSGTAKQRPRCEHPMRTDAHAHALTHTHTHTQTHTHTHTHTPCSMEVRRRWPATQPRSRRARPSSKDFETTFLRT